MSEAEIDVEALLELPPAAWQSFERPGGKIGDDERAYIKTRVVEMLADGVVRRREIFAILKVSMRELRKWCSGDANFAHEFELAQELHRSAMEDHLLALHDEHINPAMAKVQSDNIKWVLGVQDRSRYGTKVDVTDSASAGLVDVLRAAVARIPLPTSDMKTIEHEANPVLTAIQQPNTHD